MKYEYFRRFKAISENTLFGYAVVYSKHSSQSQMITNGSTVNKIDSVVSRCGYGSKSSPGLSVMVIHNGKIVETKSYGLANLENKVANNSKTNFRIASVSKQFTAMAIMILKEQKKLSYESTIKDFFPEFPDYGKNITIRQLLNHISGLKWIGIPQRR